MGKPESTTIRKGLVDNPTAQLILDDIYNYGCPQGTEHLDKFWYTCSVQMSLELSQRDIENALDLLESLGLLKYENRYSRVNDNIYLSSDAKHYASSRVTRTFQISRKL